MKQFLILFFALFNCAISFSQEYIDLLKFHYAATPKNNFVDTNDKAPLSEVGIDLTLPLKINNSLTIITGLFWENINTQLAPETEEISISTLNIRIGINKKHSEKWSGTYLLLPKISSDLKDIDKNHFQLGFLGLLKRTHSATKNYSVGLYYNQELFGPFFVPLLGLYRKTEKWEFNITLPIWADINYSISNRISAGATFSAFVRSYYLGNYDNYVVKKNNELFGYLQYKLNRSILFQAKIGYSIGRSFRAFPKNEKIDLGISAFRFGDNRKKLNSDFEDGLVFNFRMIYRFDLSN
ncbi:MAG: hypothetical protein CVT95_09755 [Bacteroidetes bacterium HGW-Bacteroidetes-12]|nr:MAG: hypothetical protein CVT95_09755 [Bacteroidetes bacterium HGW-Bacteroidetes-12]